MQISKHHLWGAARIALAVLFAVSLLTPPAALAGQPSSAVGGREGEAEPGPPPLTPEQEASATRLAQVEALIQQDSGGGITPQVFCEGTDPPPCGGVPPYSYSLGTRARHQHRSFYCGPAVV
jgi:hypothetical protein